MKSFSLNNNHDIDITNNIVQMAEGAELKRQTVECTLNTKKGEWYLNDELGADLGALLGKKSVDEDTIKNVMLDALQQVDETFRIDKLSATYDKKNRKLMIDSAASTENGDTIAISDDTIRGMRENAGSSIKFVDGGEQITGDAIMVSIVNNGFVVKMG